LTLSAIRTISNQHIKSIDRNSLMINGKPAAYVVRQIGSNSPWGVYAEDPEPYFALFARVSGYAEEDFYVDILPYYTLPTEDNIGITYS
jgi:hypothetical protein